MKRLTFTLLITLLLLGCGKEPQPKVKPMAPATDANLALVQKLIDNSERKTEFDFQGTRYTVCYGCEKNISPALCFKTSPLDTAAGKPKQEFCDQDMDGRVDYGIQETAGEHKWFDGTITTSTGEEFRPFWQQQLRSAILATLQYSGKAPAKPLLDPNIAQIIDLLPKPLSEENSAGVEFVGDGVRYQVSHGGKTPGVCFVSFPNGKPDKKQRAMFCDSDLDGAVDYGSTMNPGQTDEEFLQRSIRDEKGYWQKELDAAVAATLKHYGKPVLIIDRDF
jgi:hypothetical protein